MRRVCFRERMIACRPGLGADRGDEDEALNAIAGCGCRECRCRSTVDAIVEIFCDARCNVRNPGEMHHGIDVGKQLTPLQRASEIGDRDDLDRTREDVGGLPHCGAHAMSLGRQILDQGTPDKSRSSCHQDPHQPFLPRAKLSSSMPTSAAPMPSAAADTLACGRTTVIMASAPSPRLSRNTRNTMA